jgi:hypothetical protein
MSFVLAFLLFAQSYTQRGFVESLFTLYPQTTPNDDGHVVAEELIRYEGFYKPISNLEFAAGVDLRIDTHHQVERAWNFSWSDRTERRPIAAVRRLSALYSKSGVTVEAGKQFVRWGKTDIVAPTDRFAPRDFLAVVDNDFLPISAVRATYEHGPNTIDAVWSPQVTPSRTPLRNQRWFSQAFTPLLLAIAPADGNEAGIRWSHVGTIEYSFAYYRGANHAPSFQVIPAVPSPLMLQFHPDIQMVGGDMAAPFRWLTLKTEVAYFNPKDDLSDEYVQYVVQLERQSGEWSFVGGYAGEVQIKHRSQSGSLDPDRGLTKTFLGRADYTIDPTQSIAVETAVRQNASGAWTKLEYSRAFGEHWRVTTGAGLIAGTSSDYFGQYRRNSHGLVAIRYSF